MHRKIKRNYKFLKDNRSTLGFGYILTFFSSFGQTFLISLYVPEIIKTFNLSNAAFGSVYAVCTVASSVIMLSVGHTIDYKPVRRVTNYTVAGLAISTMLLGLSSNVFVLIVAIIGLRLTGQGLMSHISLSVMSRYYSSNRGKAISVSTLGYSIGEAVLPVLITWLIFEWGWRFSAIFSGSLLILLIPFLYITDLESLDNGSDIRSVSFSKELYKNYLHIVKDRNFLIISPSVFAVGFVITGIFFYQYVIAEVRGWSVTMYAAFFTAYALSRFVFTLAGGALVDRYTAVQMFRLYLIPLLLSQFVLMFIESIYVALVFLVLMGVTVGMSSSVKTSVLAEVYGTERIGTVRSIFAMVMVMSTAIGPLFIGTLMDYGFSLKSIYSALTVLLLAALINNQRLKNGD